MWPTAAALAAAAEWNDSIAKKIQHNKMKKYFIIDSVIRSAVLRVHFCLRKNEIGSFESSHNSHNWVN